MLKVLELFAGTKVLVSDNGEIYSMPHKKIRSNGRIDNRKGKLLKSAYDKYGYKRVVLSGNGERHTFLVHRLVAMAYIPNPSDKSTVNHKNGIKDDNRAENLEWATQSEQKHHAIKNHLCDKNIEALRQANTNKSRAVIFNGRRFPSIKSASRALGVSEWSVSRKGVFNA